MTKYDVLVTKPQHRKCLTVIEESVLTDEPLNTDGVSYGYAVYGDFSSDIAYNSPNISFERYSVLPFDSWSGLPTFRTITDTKEKIDDQTYVVECYDAYQSAKATVKVPRAVNKDYNFHKEANEILAVCEYVSSNMQERLVKLTAKVLKYLSSLPKTTEATEVRDA